MNSYLSDNFMDRSMIKITDDVISYENKDKSKNNEKGNRQDIRETGG